MKPQAKVLLTACRAIFGLSLAAAPFLMTIYAQEIENSPKTVQTEVRNQSVKNDAQRLQQERQAEREKARQEVAKSAVGSVFFDTIAAKDSEWILQKAYYSTKVRNDDPKRISMSFQKRDDAIHIDIVEYDTAEGAAETFKVPRSYGSSVEFKAFGEAGEKIYGHYGFALMNFRKGNFFISINTKDEKLAERFAGYAEESLNNLTLKK